jgi:hypothetical protein
VQRYLDSVVATDRKMIAKVHWTSRELDRRGCDPRPERYVAACQARSHQQE